MSLNIDVDDVTHVLIDTWYTVADDSFSMDAYELHWGKLPLLRGGVDKLITSTGFEFIDTNGDLITGPMTAIRALKRKRQDAADSDGHSE